MQTKETKEVETNKPTENLIAESKGLKDTTTNVVNEFKKDTLTPNDEKNNSLLNKNEKNYNFYATLGITYYIPYTNGYTAGGDRGIIAPIGGIGFEKKLKNNRLSLLFEVLYTKNRGHSLSKTSEKTTYFFEEEITKTIVNTTSFDVLRMPIMAKYRFRNKHFIFGGLFASYIINSQSDLTVTSSLKPSTTSVVKGYRDGIKDFSYGFTLGYSYKIIKQLDVGIRINYSFDDITKNTYYLNNRTDNINELQINVIWKLF